jgi:hypothetical protein
MPETVAWLAVLLPVLGTILTLVLKLTVERSVAASFDAYARRLERRSTFEDQVLTERFALVVELSGQLEQVMTNLNRSRAGQVVPDGFRAENEIVPLTDVFTTLEIKRLLLTDELYDILQRSAQLALHAANARSLEDWQAAGHEWGTLRAELRAAVDRTFRLSSIQPP